MSPDEKYVALTKRVELFQGIDPEDVEKIFQRGMTMRVRKDETIFYQGTTGDQMFVVLGGVIGIMDGKRKLAEVRLGGIFGEMALITDEPRSATAVALEDSHLFALNETTFEKLLTKRVAVRMLLNIIGSLSHRLQASNKVLHDLGNATGPTQV
jgi:CRP-like cAMP-binding protein